MKDDIRTDSMQRIPKIMRIGEKRKLMHTEFNDGVIMMKDTTTHVLSVQN